MSMVPASQLRVYEPLGSFPEHQRARWGRALSGLAEPRPWAYRDAAGGPGEVGLLFPVEAGQARVRRIHGEELACPWSVRMGVLAAVVACHDDDDACGSLVSQAEVEAAAGELARLQVEQPAERDHVLFSAWHVPMRWLAAFDDAERVLERSGRTGVIRLRYETDLAVGIGRLQRAEAILDGARMAPGMIAPVTDLAAWLAGFDPGSTLELDYAGLTTLMAPEALEADRSAGEIWACLEAMELGDLDECHRRYADLAAWWDEIRSVERRN